MSVSLVYKAQDLSGMPLRMYHLDTEAFKPKVSCQSSLGVSTIAWLQPKDTALLMNRFVFSKEQFIYLILFLFFEALVHSLVNLESNKEATSFASRKLSYFFQP